MCNLSEKEKMKIQINSKLINNTSFRYRIESVTLMLAKQSLIIWVTNIPRRTDEQTVKFSLIKK